MVQKETFPDCLRITATEESGQIMALEHKNFQIYGLQFHPESFLTEYGYEILGNFVRIGVKS
jgi:anthranilate/para-aminobenzoate synthase component II